MTDAHIFPNSYPELNKEGFLAFTRNPADLFRSPYALFFIQKYMIVEDDRTPGNLKVTTLSYEYNIERRNDKQEILCFHWEGLGAKNQIPHIHIGAAYVTEHSPFNNKSHIPSGRVSVEDLVTFLIKELGVGPTRKRKHDWEHLVAKTKALFHRYKRW